MSHEADIRQRFWTELSQSPFLMVGLQGAHDHSTPMTAQLDQDANHCFWFFTSRGNRLAAGGPAMAQFVAKEHSLFACIDGTLVEERDSTVIDRHWSQQVAAWYSGGRDDPNLLMLRFDLDHAEIWQADLSIGGIFKQLFGGDVRNELRGKHVEVDL